MMTSTDWLRRMEEAVRRQKALPIDAFLPELVAGHMETPPPPAPPQDPAPEIGVPFSERREAVPRPPSAAASSPQEGPVDLDAEIQEFINKDRRGLSDDDDFSDLLGSGIDPNVD